MVFELHVETNYTAGIAIYKDNLYGILYVIPMCYVESGI